MSLHCLNLSVWFGTTGPISKRQSFLLGSTSLFPHSSHPEGTWHICTNHFASWPPVEDKSRKNKVNESFPGISGPGTKMRDFCVFPSTELAIYKTQRWCLNTLQKEVLYRPKIRNLSHRVEMGDTLKNIQSSPCCSWGWAAHVYLVDPTGSHQDAFNWC